MYRVQLQEFEGPLDLLLFFIRRDELDIYDIPIARIADEFLEYVRLLERIDLDGVGDFIYMAALLIAIKARMLLPLQDVDEEGEPVDPRRELVERLLDYIRFKEAAQKMQTLQNSRAEYFTRGAASGESNRSLEQGPLEFDLSIFDLVQALRRILSKAPDEPVHAVERFEYSVEDQQKYILAKLSSVPNRTFRDLVRKRSKPFIITTFLAVLELSRQGLIIIQIQNTNIDDFWVCSKEKFSEKHSNGVAA